MAQVSRLEKKLEACFEGKEYYEAHQICRTLFYRLTTAGKFEELLALLERGCLTLSGVKEYGSAYDLSEAFAETLLKSGVPVNEQRLTSIAKIAKSLPSQIEEGLEGDKDRRIKFIAACVKWSQAVSTSPAHKARGSPALHGFFARLLYSEGAVDMARAHFMLSDAPEDFAVFLHDWFVRGEVAKEKSADVWITIAILQLICLRRLAFSRRLLAAYMAAAAPAAAAPYRSEGLAHFAWMLVRMCPTKNVHHLSALLARYQPSFPRQEEESLIALMDQLSQAYFGLPPPRAAMGGGGMLGGLIKSMMGGPMGGLGGAMGGGGAEQKKEQLPSSDDEGEQPVDSDARLYQAELVELLKVKETVHEDVDLD